MTSNMLRHGLELITCRELELEYVPLVIDSQDECLGSQCAELERQIGTKRPGHGC